MFARERLLLLASRLEGARRVCLGEPGPGGLSAGRPEQSPWLWWR